MPYRTPDVFSEGGNLIGETQKTGVIIQMTLDFVSVMNIMKINGNIDGRRFTDHRIYDG
jgi:hypothetical protein